ILVLAVVLTIGYLVSVREPVALDTQPHHSIKIPPGYTFHLGHIWVASEGGESVRVGIDSFAADLLGTVEKLEATPEQRWVRQGQKLIAVTCRGEHVEMVSPIEGVVTAINPAVRADPSLATKDPYRDGWVCLIKSPEVGTDMRNLLPPGMVARWM